MQAVIMAGGKGTRLHAITNDKIPKPMALVAGRPLLEHQIECLKRQGITDIVMVIGHLGHKIQEYFGDGKKFGVKLTYIEETVPLGTAGILSQLPPFLGGAAFFLIFGDILFDIDLERMWKFHTEKNAYATLFIHPNTHPFDSDLVEYDSDGRIRRLLLKHDIRTGFYRNCVNAGIYIFDKKVCSHVPKLKKTDLEKELLTALVKEGRAIYGYRSPEYVKDVGTVERIHKAEEELQNNLVSARSLLKRQRAIFLDRDGTINRKDGLIYQESQFELEPYAIEAIRRINGSGYLAIVVTNQPVVARGLCRIEDVEQIHKKMETLFGREGVYLDDICFCPHHPDKGYPEENPAYKMPCRCRKPGIGMLMTCAEKYNIDLKASWMIGDTTVDIQTGKNAGSKTALVLTGEAGQDGKYSIKPNLICKDLLEAVEKILKFELV